MRCLTILLALSLTEYAFAATCPEQVESFLKIPTKPVEPIPKKFYRLAAQMKAIAKNILESETTTKLNLKAMTNPKIFASNYSTSEGKASVHLWYDKGGQVIAFRKIVANQKTDRCIHQASKKK